MIFKNLKNFLPFLLIFFLASFFRLWKITSAPAGLFPDEAANGLDIVENIFQGRHSVFFERGLGREGLFFYLQAVSVKLFGIGVWQLHIVSAIIGILTVILTFLLAKNLFGKRIAFLSSFFLATSYWHTTLSRTGFRAILVPFFATLFIYFAYLTFKERKNIYSILAGISLGLGFYTYISFRAFYLIVLALFFVILFWHREILKKFWRQILLGFISMILVMAPLIIYFFHHPWFFFGRAGYVSIFNPDLNKGDLLGTFFDVLKKTILMFFTEGDLNWRHNVSGFAMINPFVSFFFLFGFLYSLFVSILGLLKLKRDYFKYLILIIWFFGMLGPHIMSVESIPHGLRAIGTIPVVFLFPAISFNLFWEKIKKIKKSVLGVILGLFLLFSLFYDAYLYFGISLNSPDFYYAYRSDLTVVSEYLNQRNLKDKTYLVLDPYSVQTPQFLTAEKGQPYILVEPWKIEEVKLKEGDQIVFTQSTMKEAFKFERLNFGLKKVKSLYNKFNEEIMRVYER